MANVDDAPPVGSWRKSVYPVYIEAQAGIGSKPAGMFSIGDDKDRALAWVKTIKNAVPVLALVLGLAATALAGIPTPNLGLNKWTKGDLSSDYLPKQNADMDTLDAAICDKRGSCVIAGDLNVLGTIVSTNTGTLGGGGAVGFVQDNFLPFVDGSTKAFVLSNTPAADSLIVFVRNGLVQNAPQDFTITANKVYTTVAPSLLTSSLFIQYSTVTSPGGGGGGGGTVVTQYPLQGTGTVGDPVRVDQSSVTLLGPKIDIGELTFVPATSFDLAVVGSSTQSLQDQIDAGIPASVIVDSPLLGNGSSGSHLRVDSSSVTLLGPKIDASEVTFALVGESNTYTSSKTFTNGVLVSGSGDLKMGSGNFLTSSIRNDGPSLLAWSALSDTKVHVFGSAGSNYIAASAYDGFANAPLIIGGPSGGVGSSLSLNFATIDARDITSISSVNASGFFGDGRALTGTVIAVSSSPIHNPSIASLTYIGIATATMVNRGGRPLNIFATGTLVNGGGGSRVYTCIITDNSVQMGGTYVNTVSAGDNHSVSFQRFQDSSSSGSHSYSLLCNSSSVTGTQTFNSAVIRPIEF